MSWREWEIFYFAEPTLPLKLYFTECVFPTLLCAPEHWGWHPALACSPASLLHLPGDLSCG